ncbi:catalase [Sulfitobacter sp. HNIBRBA3233]|uniref:catalase n=1 Tax=Sulfitobacter marinivivus TaxID=3158558 RepID=UPI0032DE32D1
MDAIDDSEIAERIVDELARPDGSPALRPVHSIGIGAVGYFNPSRVAQDYCTAAHFKRHSETKVSLRFSNGSGSATVRDGWSDVRGLAVRFHLPDKTDTDLVAMTLPEFFTPTPETFLDFTIRAKPKPVVWQSPWRKILDMLRLIPPAPDPYPGEKISPNMGAIAYANEHKSAQLSTFEAASIGAPTSYARAAYHAVHTFFVTGTDGTRRPVRFSWQPIAGVKRTDPTKPPRDRYLQDELRQRLENEPARFSLMMMIGENGDAFEDSTKPWPPHRIRVMMGTLTITGVPKDQETFGERISFNPWLLTKGIEPSGDPVLHLRRHAYNYSSKKRGGIACPFTKGHMDD